MFDQPTVFILGAGASWHYNYPTGEDLVRRVIGKAQIVIKCYDNELQLGHRNSSSVINDIYKDVFNINDPTHHQIKDFLQNFVDRLTHVDPPVIDYFLEWNKDLQGLGKLFIAWVMLEREREYKHRGGNVNRERIHRESPVVRERNEGVDIKSYKDNWYRLLLYKIVTECQESSNLKNNKVWFITFNYDVSLETYLYKGLRAIQFLKKNDEDIENFLSNRFIHMYGKIRQNPFVDPIPVIAPVPAEKTVKTIAPLLNEAHIASDGIKTIGDNKHDQDAITAATQMIEHAQQIYILGYGFDKINNDRLNLQKLLSQDSLNQKGLEYQKRMQTRICFTNYQDSNSINKKAGRALVGRDDVFLTGESFIYKSDGVGGFDSRAIYEKSIKDVYEALERDFDTL